MATAVINLMNDVGVKLDIDTTDPENLALTAYDFEGNELSGGGGGSISFDICNITIVNTTASTVSFFILPQLSNSALIANDEIITSVSIAANSEYNVSLPFVWARNEDAPVIMLMLENAVSSDAVNCSYVTGEPGFIVRTSNGNASITLTV